MHLSDNTNQVIAMQLQAALPCYYKVCPVTDCDVHAGIQESSSFSSKIYSQATCRRFLDAVRHHLNAAIQGKKMSCPTCRACTKVTDVAYVDNGRGYSEGEEGQASSSAAKEAATHVEGSYGTKVSTTHSLLVCMAKARSSARVIMQQQSLMQRTSAGQCCLQSQQAYELIAQQLTQPALHVRKIVSNNAPSNMTAKESLQKLAAKKASSQKCSF